MLRGFYQDKLTGYLYDAYYELDSAVRSFAPECMMRGLSSEEAQRVICAYMYENPDLWQPLLQFVNISTSRSGILLHLRYDEAEARDFDDALDRITEELDKRITNYSTDSEIVRIVYDHLCKYIEGDTEAECAFSRIDRSDFNAINDYAAKYGRVFTAYGAIVDKHAACMGTAFAFKLLLDRYRVECAVVPGISEGVPHMMNAVEIDGVTSLVDLTRGLIQKDFPMIRYNYYLVSGERIKEYFEIDALFDRECLDGSDNFFTSNHLVFKEGFKLRRYLDSVSFNRVHGEIRFRYTGRGYDDDGIEKMMGGIMTPRCGSEYEMVGYISENGVGNCLIKKREG